MSETQETKADSQESTEPPKSDMVIEGQANILMATSKNVFYNPVQQFNRDLSVAAIRVFSQDFHKTSPTQNKIGVKHENGLIILEALSASGLRSIRYAKEVPGILEIVANDISETAVTSIRENAARNEVSHLVTPSHCDASLLMYKNPRHYHVVDLDPYGCPSIFLDSAVQTIAEGGLLLVTCTDMGVLSGNSPETCRSKYGAVSIRVPACHEMALRIVLQCIESHANRHDRYLVPLLSISADFYVRVFVTIHSLTSPSQRPLDVLATVYHCVGCHTVSLHKLSERGQPVDQKCEHCGHGFTIGGPVWSGPLHDPGFVARLRDGVDDGLGTAKRMRGVLAVVAEELPDTPLYTVLDKLSAVVHAQTMPMIRFRSALLNAGYRVSFSHAHKNSVKTDAPARFVWDVLRAWVKRNPVRADRKIGAALAILSREPVTEVSFEPHINANPESRLTGLSRFPVNPQRYWGPGTRAQSGQTEQQIAKKKRNQDKYKKRRERPDSSLSPVEKHAKVEEADS